MICARRIGLVLGTVAVLVNTALAQRYVARASAPLSARSLNHLGLERLWQTHVEVDSSRGALTFVTPHVSRSAWATVYDVDHQGGTKSFDERNLNRFGRPMGRAQAAHLADVEKRVLATRNIEATVVERRVPMVTLYAQTDRGVLHAIDGETGRTKWTYSVGSARYPSLAPGANDRYVATVNGSTLYVFNVAEEKIAWQKRLGAAPGAGPALTNDTVYVPLLNGMIRGYSLDDGSVVVSLRSIGRPMVQPYALGTSLAWPTHLGYLYMVDTNENTLRFRFETNGEVIGNAAYMEPERAIVAVSDGHAYAIDQLSGQTLWQVSLGAVINEPPMVVGDRAYIINRDGEMSSVDGESGRILWSIPRMRRVVAGNNDRVYAIGMGGDLVALDRESGVVLGRVSAKYDVQVPNSFTDRIYLGSARGSLICLRSVGQDTPVVHISIPELNGPPVGAEADGNAADGDAAGGNAADESGDAVPSDRLPSEDVGSDNSLDDPLDDGGADPFADEADPFAEDSDPFQDGGGPLGDDELDDEMEDEADPFGEDGEEDPFAGDDGDAGGDDGGDDPDADPFTEEDPFAEEDPFG